MAKIMSGNWNDLPWMPNHSKDVNGKVMCKTKCFAMECANLLYNMGEMENGMPIGQHCHKHEQIATCIQGEVDYVVDGILRTIPTMPMCIALLYPASSVTCSIPLARTPATPTRNG